MKKKLVIATHNKGKTKEIKTIIGDIGWTILTLDNFAEIGEAIEPADSFADNAVAKAQYYSRTTRHWVLADDSGLEVTALGGAPGVLSARYAGPAASDEERRSRILGALVEAKTSNRQARFVCAAAIADPTGQIVKITEGVCNGFISESARGDSGFGYDPIFVPNGYDKTFGELTETVKNRISHRAQAMIAMRTFLIDKQERA